LNWLERPALGLLAALIVLALLVFLQRGAKKLRVGTLFIWRRVAATQDARKRKARLEPVLWLCAAALVVAALASARPALAQAGRGPVVAVFIERLAPGTGSEPDAAELAGRVQDATDGAELRFFATEKTGAAEIDDKLTQLAPGNIADELAQFRARSHDADGRVVLLCEPDAAVAEWAQVWPRSLNRRDGVIFGLNLRGKRIFVRSSGFGGPEFKGARLVAARSSNGETTREYEATAADVEFTAAGAPTIRLKEAAPVALVSGGKWSSDAHKALSSALLANSNYLQAERGQVGLDAEAPLRIEILRGTVADLAGASAGFDSQHALFAQLPLSAFDWLADARVLEVEEGDRVLLSAVKDGRQVGALIALSGDGKVLRFAGDPFARAPVAAAALLLDNALGVITGERPSEGARLKVISGGELPSERAAFAAPFDPQGSLDMSTSGTESLNELTPWLALAGALLALVAAWLTR
jgi:hypothetical protein